MHKIDDRKGKRRNEMEKKRRRRKTVNNEFVSVLAVLKCVYLH